MGVMRCNRNGCENVMCDRYSSDFGYICNDCLDELKTMPHTNVGHFMESEKPSNKPNDAWNKFVEDLFSDGMR